MEAKPMRRYLLVEPYEKQEEERETSDFAGFVVTEEYYNTRKDMDRFELFKIKKIGEFVEGSFYVGQVVVVETSMLENVKTPEGNCLFIAENYIPVVFE